MVASSSNNSHEAARPEVRHGAARNACEERFRTALENADLVLDPFPHIVVPRLLNDNEVAAALANWPAESDMTEEPGNLRRHWVELVVQHETQQTPVLDANDGFWRDFIAEILEPLYAQICRRFGALIEQKLDAIKYLHFGQLTLMQSDDEFEVHPVHSHYPIGPGWLFTVLIQLDDGRETGRGTRFFKAGNADEIATATAAEKARSLLDGFTDPSMVIDTGFTSGQALAFFDGPFAFHGSTPMDVLVGPGSRKIIRCHLLAPPEDTLRAYGCERGMLFLEALRHIAGSTTPSANASFDIEKVIAGLESDFSARAAWLNDPGRFTTVRETDPFAERTLPSMLLPE